MISVEQITENPAVVATKKPMVQKEIELQDDSSSQSSSNPTELSRRNSFSSLKSIDSRMSFQGLALPEVCRMANALVTPWTTSDTDDIRNVPSFYV